MFSWEAGAKGLDVHALAEPTKLEALKKEYEAKKTDFKSDAKQGRNFICYAFNILLNNWTSKSKHVK